MRYAGDALSMHPILVSGKGAINGLRSPSAKSIEYGDGVSVGLGYWGSLVCRAGMMLGAPDAGYFEGVVTPYYRAIATWHQTMRIGVTGGEVFGAIDQAFGASPLRPALNPGHLTSYDEWVHSPIRAGSTREGAVGDGLPVRHHPDAAAAGPADELRGHGGGGGRGAAGGAAGELSGAVGAGGGAAAG